MTLWLLYRRDAARGKGRMARYPAGIYVAVSVYRKVQAKVMGVTMWVVGARLRISIASPSDCPGTVAHVLLQAVFGDRR